MPVKKLMSQFHLKIHQYYAAFFVYIDCVIIKHSYTVINVILLSSNPATVMECKILIKLDSSR